MLIISKDISFLRGSSHLLQSPTSTHNSLRSLTDRFLTASVRASILPIYLNLITCLTYLGVLMFQRMHHQLSKYSTSTTSSTQFKVVSNVSMYHSLSNSVMGYIKSHNCSQHTQA